MSRAFADISFTPSVKAAQARYGSRENNRGFELAEDPRNELLARDMAFIAARDSFYQTTVSETGWPYVQHRGGPAGFLRVLDTCTVGYADFQGNTQYLSVGNLNADERISLILMDYPKRRRLKLWGRARIVEAADEPALIARLDVPGYGAPAERAVLIHIEGNGTVPSTSPPDTPRPNWPPCLLRCMKKSVGCATCSLPALECPARKDAP